MSKLNVLAALPETVILAAACLVLVRTCMCRSGGAT